MSRVFLMEKASQLKHTYSMKLRRGLEAKGWKLAIVIDGKDMSYTYMKGYTNKGG